jgi:large subunit ribosomal protein L18
LSVFSNKEIYAQLIDDVNGVTILGFFKRKEIGKGTNVDVATAVGKPVAEKALKVGIAVTSIEEVTISVVLTLAEGERAGLKF